MSFLPREAFVVETSEPARVLVERLTAVTSLRKRWEPPRQNSRFRGEVSPSGFEVIAWGWGTDSFTPVLTGRFQEGPSGTLVHVTMQLRTWVSARMVYCFGCAWVFVFVGLFLMLTNRDGAWPAVAAGVFMVMCFSLMTRWKFRRQARRSRELITSVLKGTPE